MNRSARICALIAAAGAGRRLAAELAGEAAASAKAFLPLGGRPMFLYSLDVLARCTEIGEILVLAPADLLAEAAALVAANDASQRIRVVPGGDTRQESIYAGLRHVSPATDYVLAHDAARPFLTDDMVRRCLAAARKYDAAICAMPVTDTIKGSDDGEWVADTLQRDRLWGVQTPQAFSYQLLLQAHEQAARTGIEASDDAGLVEALGHRVRIVLGAADNIKITRRADLDYAQQRLDPQPIGVTPAMRIGLGFDTHAFDPKRPLILAGVSFPGPGLAGHSDADLVCHAAADALLGAAGLGDIGLHFPDTDPRFAGASSIALLAQVGEMVAAAGLHLASMDIVVATQEPKLAPAVGAMKMSLAQALAVSPACISLKGKTTEGLGFVGREEGMACWAVCILSTTPALQRA